MLSGQQPQPQTPSEWGKKEEVKLRVDKVHGGTLVEEIETPEPMNNQECEHEWEIDPTETDFLAYMCIKKDCGIVMLYDK